MQACMRNWPVESLCELALLMWPEHAMFQLVHSVDMLLMALQCRTNLIRIVTVDDN